MTTANTGNAGAWTAHYISGTHWDREWYRPLQEYRLLLVRLIDELMDLMETSPDFKYFQLDGQTCVLSDYTEIRPERKERLARLIRDGRILIGPWFTMPDLFCAGDEALIRNLLLGRRLCQEWGVEPMPVGFICDMFGHPSQMPQIFSGFGLNDCVLGRGVNEHTTPAFFHWESPDGSRVFTFKLQDSQGYGAFIMPRAMLENSPDRPMLVVGPDHPLHKALEEAGPDEAAHTAAREKLFKEALGKYIRHEQSRANGTALCLMDAMDHVPPATEVGRYIKLIGEFDPAVITEHSTLPRFFKDARRLAQSPPTRRGELREPSKTRNGYLWLIPNCVSARVRLKLANDQCQNLLEKWVEPLLALANLRAERVPHRYLQVAWQHVLTNHAHDTICGCSIDQVHRDMMARFETARVLGQQLAYQGLHALTESCRELATAKDEFTLILVNALPVRRDEVVTFDIDLPPDYPATFQEGFGTQLLKAFTLEDEQGRDIPYQRLAMIPSTNERSHLAQFCFLNDGNFTRYTVAARVDLPATGYTALKVKPAPMPVRAWGSLRSGPNAAANEHLAIAIEPTGALTLTDKTTGQTFTNLLTLEDRSELGDGWFHGHSLNDEQILSTAGQAQVSVVHDGPEMVSFRSTITLSVPLRYDYGKELVSDQRVDLVVTSKISLRRGARVVDVETTVDNTAEDHRLRLLLPTDAAEARTWLAHHPYDLTERSIALDPATANWQEAEISEKPFLGLQAVGSNQRGLAFISAGGLHEGGVMDDSRRTMHITLLRSFRRTVGTGGEPDGLEKARIVYRYALMPYAGPFPAQTALTELAKLQAGLLTRQSGKRSSGFPTLRGDRGRQSSLELLDQRLVLSACKPGEDGRGLVLRLWNPTGAPQSERVRLAGPIKSAQAVTLAETADHSAKPPAVSGDTLTVNANPHQILTVRVELVALR
jgi:alpha-mannosidase/mannosylglycerate hydrolase